MRRRRAWSCFADNLTRRWYCATCAHRERVTPLQPNPKPRLMPAHVCVCVCARASASARERVCARDTPLYLSLSIPLAASSARTHILPLATRRPRVRRLNCIRIVDCHVVKTRVFDTMGAYLAAERSHIRSRCACAVAASCCHSYRFLRSNGATTTLCCGTRAHIHTVL